MVEGGKNGNEEFDVNFPLVKNLASAEYSAIPWTDQLNSLSIYRSE